MDGPFALATLGRRGLLTPGRPMRMARQLAETRRWGLGFGGTLRAAAARDPDRVALVDESTVRTYAQLLADAEQLAAGLRAQAAPDAQAGDRIGLLCRNHAGLVLALAACALLGVDPVLLNTGMSAPQLARVGAGQRLRAIIFDSEFREQATVLPEHLERVDESMMDDLIRHSARGPLDPAGRDGHTIVLTSGTNGTPKGTRRPDPAGVVPFAGVIARIPLRVHERVMVSTPVFHSLGLSAVHTAFAVRGTAVLQRRFEPVSTMDMLAEQDCTALFAVPTMLQRMLAAPARVPPGLRVVVVSGSVLPGGLAGRFMDVYGDVLYNLYGSTEAATISIATPSEIRRAPGTAGRPPRGTRVAILGPDRKPVRAGRTGRIVVASETVVDGYTTGRPPEMYGGMLDTGDLGHVGEDGLLFVDGRADDMIVSGGENVFPGQVENLLAALPQVQEVAVVGAPDPEFGQRLVACIALHPGERLDVEAVRDHVRRNLARHEVPSEVRFLDALPRNATGKVVRGLLQGERPD